MNEPHHGDYGDRHVTTRFSESGTSATTVWADARWCDGCREWVVPAGVVSLILSTCGCPQCGKKW